MGLRQRLTRTECALALVLGGQVAACIAWLTCIAMGDLAFDKSGLGDFGVFSRWQVKSHVALAFGVALYALSIVLSLVRRRQVGPSASWIGWWSVVSCAVVSPVAWYFAYVVFLVVWVGMLNGGHSPQ